jgi:microsomal dipeptidase-like Zn-dependent dipeptidase
MVRVAGPDHVALGSSFEDGVSRVVDFRTAADFPRLARALHDSGLAPEVVEHVFYKNARRVLCQNRRGVAQRAKYRVAL